MNDRQFTVDRRHAAVVRAAHLGALLSARRHVGARRIRPHAPVRLPQLPASEGHRPPQGGHAARDRARGHRRGPDPAAPRAACRVPARHDDARAARRRADRRDPAGARRADGRGRLRAADRLRERGEPAARAHRPARARPRAARGARRQPRAAGAAAAWSRARCWPSPAARSASPSAPSPCRC